MLVTCQRFGEWFLFGLVWQYSSIQKNIIKVGAKSWMLTCSYHITLSLPFYTDPDSKRELNFCNGYLSLLYFWGRVSTQSWIFYSREQKHILLLRKLTLIGCFKPRHATKQNVFLFRITKLKDSEREFLLYFHNHFTRHLFLCILINQPINIKINKSINKLILNFCKKKISKLNVYLLI